MSRGRGWIWLGRILIERHFPFVTEKILQMPLVQHERDLCPECDTIFDFMAMIMMELTLFECLHGHCSSVMEGHTYLGYSIDNISNVDGGTVRLNVGVSAWIDFNFVTYIF